MARCLIIGCGCRGRALAAELSAQGHAVRGTTRDRDNASALETAGIEPFIGDPDRIATLTAALEHVAVACILLGSAKGADEAVRALHSTRLEMLLTKMVDTTVRGIVYEAAGAVDAGVLTGGAERVRSLGEDSQIPYALISADPSDHEAWLRDAVAAVQRALGS